MSYPVAARRARRLEIVPRPWPLQKPTEPVPAGASQLMDGVLRDSNDEKLETQHPCHGGLWRPYATVSVSARRTGAARLVDGAELGTHQVAAQQ